MTLALISFDLDGTLVDSASEIIEAANRTLQALGLPRQPDANVQALIGHGSHTLMRRLLARTADGLAAGPDAERDALARFDLHYAQTTGSTSRLYDGAAEVLARLRAKGFKLACVTNKEQVHAHRLLAHHRLDACFDLLVGGDSLPQAKPHASVLRTVATMLGVLPSVHNMAHVGDSAIDVMAAHNAGVAAWAVPHGYNGGQPVASAGPDLLLSDLMAVVHAAQALRLQVAQP